MRQRRRPRTIGMATGLRMSMRITGHPLCGLVATLSDLRMGRRPVRFRLIGLQELGRPERLPARPRSRGSSRRCRTSDDRVRCWAKCEWFDETCGELLDVLNERGLAENTLVLFVTDNGWISETDRGGFAPRSNALRTREACERPIIARRPANPRRTGSGRVSRPGDQPGPGPR